MKKILVAVSAILVLASCQTKEFKENAEGLTFTGPQISILTDGVKTTYTQAELEGGKHGFKTGWAANDKIGVYAIADGTLYAENVAFVTPNEAYRTTFGAVETGISYVAEAAIHDFQAYYPYKQGIAYANGLVTVTLPAKQKQLRANDASHLANTDFLYATPVSKFDQEETIEMDFKHAFSILELDLTTALDSVEVTSIEVTCADGKLSGKGQVDIAEAGAFSLETGYARVYLEFSENPVIKATDENPTKVYMQILPGHANQEMTVTISAKETLSITKITPASDIPAGRKAVKAIAITSVPKCESGVSNTTPTLVWKKKVSEITGVNDPANVNNLAYSNGHLVLGENGNFAPAYVDAMTGTPEGTLDLSAMSSYGNDYALCADKSGKIWLCNSVVSPAAATDLCVFATSDVATPPHKLTHAKATRSIGASHICGVKLSAAGPDADGRVVLGTPYYHSTNSQNRMCAYFIMSKNETAYFGWPQVKWNLSGTKAEAALWATSGDCVWESTNVGTGVIYSATSSPSAKTEANPTANLRQFLISRGSGTDTSPAYSTVAADVRSLEIYGGATNLSYTNSVDFTEFNNAKYAAYNSVRNTTIYGTTGGSAIPYNTCDRVMLMNVTNGISEPTFISKNHQHGSAFVSGKTIANANAYGDVIFHVSENGYYLYAYVMFAAGGEVACYRYDCIKQ